MADESAVNRQSEDARTESLMERLTALQNEIDQTIACQQFARCKCGTIVKAMQTKCGQCEAGGSTAATKVEEVPSSYSTTGRGNENDELL